MRVFLIGLFVFLLWGTVARYYYICEIKGHCGELIQPQRPQTLQVREGKVIVLEGYEQFFFPPNSPDPVMTDNNDLLMVDLNRYLAKYPEKDLTITGLFLESELDTALRKTMFENLGIMRAAEVRNQLAATGMDTEGRVFLDFKMYEGETLPEEPVTFRLSAPAPKEMPEGEERPKEYTKLSYTFTNMTFTDANFEYNSDVFRPGSSFMHYADSVKAYLALHPDKTLTVIGHTDNIGGDDFNDDLGLRRAKNAGLYFEKLGVTNKIKVKTEGKRSPVAPNDSPENRQKNRRVNILIE